MPRKKRSPCRFCSKPVAYSGMCQNCARAYQRVWREENREHYREWQLKYRAEHCEEIRVYNREYQRHRRALMAAGKWNFRKRKKTA